MSSSRPLPGRVFPFVPPSLSFSIGRVLQFEEVPIKWPPVDREALAGQELVDEQFDSLVEANDILLERIVSMPSERN